MGGRAVGLAQGSAQCTGERGSGADGPDAGEMAALALQARSAQEPKRRYAFWETQPVSQFRDRRLLCAPGRPLR